MNFDPEAAARLKNSRLMKPVSAAWALLAVSAASALAGFVGFAISGNRRIFFAWLLCVPFFFVVLPLCMGIANTITGTLSVKVSARRRRKRREPNKAVAPYH